MAKRFTDSDKWKKPLIRSLKAPYKLLWLYILDDCDHAGIWQVDLQVAEIRTGESLDEQEAIKSFGEKIQVIDGGEKWFIRDFIEFQYGELNPKNRVHESVLEILKRYKIKPLTSPLQGVKDKDKDKDMDKDKEKGAIKFENFWDLYPVKVGKSKCIEKWEKLTEGERGVIIAKLPEWIKYKPFEKYTHPHPLTFLNGKRWQDEIPEFKLTAKVVPMDNKIDYNVPIENF